MNRQTFRTCGRINVWRSPGFIPPGNGGRIFFLPSAVVVGENADARGTEAVKLSVKLLSGLTLIAFVAVAVVGLSHSASAAVDAKVYVTNKASTLTTEGSGKPTGRTTAATVYGTYASYASTGTTARDIVADSDRFIVTVLDQDLNVTSTITSNQTSNAGYAVDRANLASNDVTQVSGSGFDSAGDKVQVTITDDKATPIIGAVSDIKVVSFASGNVMSGISVTSIDYAGDGVNAPLITLQVDFGSYAGGAAGPTVFGVPVNIVYPTSAADVTTASVKSVVYTGAAAVVTLTETGRNTGRFEGEVLVSERTTALTEGSNGGSSDSPAIIPAIAGPITIAYNDVATSGTATNTTRTATYNLDVTVPTATITAPATAAESQSRLPTFTGAVTDNGSGIDVSTFALHIDNTTDPKNAAQIITGGASRSSVLPGTPALPTIIGKIASIDMSAKTDGVNSLPFSYTETVVLPNSGVTNPDHIVDFQAKVADLAGNFGYSDSDTAVGNFNGTGRHGAQPHTIKIDQIIPQISSVETGISWDTSIATPAEKADVNTSLVVRFDGKIKDSSVAASDFQVTLSGAGGVFVPGTVTVKDANVYIDIASAIPSNNTPTVKIQGTVQDLAGNSTDAGSKVALDKLSPVLTVVRSAGSGTGTGTEAADSLTKANMTVTVTSDEDLQSAPQIYVTDITSTGGPVSTVGNVNNGTFAVSAGGNKWTLVIAKGASSDGSRAIKVTGTDTSNNAGSTGKDTVKAYVLDATLSAPVSTPAGSGTTTQSNPFLTTDFSADAHSVTITSATLDTVDVTADVIASADSKTFFYQPTTALTNAEHTYVVKAIDAAGTKLDTTTKFTKSDRVSFVLELFAGWNSVSFPSDPVDTAIDSAMSNTGIAQVVAYDATTPSQPWRIASKVDGTFTSQTEPALSSITAGPGYWVESSNFEDQTVSLSGPTSPGDARPGLTTIPTGNGWNLVGVVDQSRSQTQKANKGAILTRPNASGSAVNVTNTSYFGGVNNGRAYTFDTVTSKFREQVGADTLNIGSGIWVFISPRDNGQLPHIVP